MDENHVIVLQFVVEDVAVGILDEVSDQGNAEDESGVEHEAVPPSDYSFNDHREEDSTDPYSELVAVAEANRSDTVERNQHINAGEDDRVLKLVKVRNV